MLMFFVRQLMKLLLLKYSFRVFRAARKSHTCLHDSETTGKRLSEELAFGILEDYFHGPDLHEEVFCRDHKLEQFKGIPWFRGRMVFLATIYLGQAGYNTERISRLLQKFYTKDMERKDALKQVEHRIGLYLRRYFLPQHKGMAFREMLIQQFEESNRS